MHFTGSASIAENKDLELQFCPFKINQHFFICQISATISQHSVGFHQYNSKTERNGREESQLKVQMTMMQ